MSKIVTGIQQVGIGVSDLESAWAWYRKMFGMDIQVFKDTAEARLMAGYTGGDVHSRTAVLATNMAGGGGFEIWQYESRDPSPPAFGIKVGDLGIFAVSLHSRDIGSVYSMHSSQGASRSQGITADPEGRASFFTADPRGNLFQVVQSGHVFVRTAHACGGVAGVCVGVTDIDRARPLYSDILGYDRMLYDTTGVFADLSGLPGGAERVRRVKLGQSRPGVGNFGRLFGASTVELFHCLEREPNKIFADRYWGDLGYIHVCFDVKDMDAIKGECEAKGFPFTVDSLEAFEMGAAGGRFGYTEDPEGTLIELVETYRLPILKSLGLYLDLTKRRPDRPIPDWILRAMRFSRVRN